MGHLYRSLPILDYQNLEQPLKVLQRFLQVVGKIRLATVPARNHWWHVTFFLTSRGLTTGPMPVGRSEFPDTFEIELDLVNHRLKCFDSWGHSFIFSLLDLSVTSFYSNLCYEMDRIGIRIPIHAYPYKIEPHIPFEKDTLHIYQQGEVITNYFDSLRFADHQLKLFASGYVGKESPAQLFWHSMDLAISRFNGRSAQNPPPRERDAVAHEAYSHELISFGFWGGDDKYPAPAFYSYAWPLPENVTEQRLAPEGALWHQSPTGPLAVLPYELVRTSSSPRDTVQEFFHRAFEIGCGSAGWDKEKLVSEQIGFNNAERLQYQFGPSVLPTDHH